MTLLDEIPYTIRLRIMLCGCLMAMQCTVFWYDSNFVSFGGCSPFSRNKNGLQVPYQFSRGSFLVLLCFKTSSEVGIPPPPSDSRSPFFEFFLSWSIYVGISYCGTVLMPELLLGPGPEPYVQGNVPSLRFSYESQF